MAGVSLNTTLKSITPTWSSHVAKHALHWFPLTYFISSNVFRSWDDDTPTNIESSLHLTRAGPSNCDSQYKVLNLTQQSCCQACNVTIVVHGFTGHVRTAHAAHDNSWLFFHACACEKCSGREPTYMPISFLNVVTATLNKRSWRMEVMFFSFYFSWSWVKIWKHCDHSVPFSLSFYCILFLFGGQPFTMREIIIKTIVVRVQTVLWMKFQGLMTDFCTK